tara:strand:+ start:309 stop:515 length:207 start_codon:yes stop_codon:yes gene_type:complete
MDRIKRSVTRDIKTMSLGLGAINKEIEFLETKVSKDKSSRKRLERLYTAKMQLESNPEKSKELMEKFK